MVISAPSLGIADDASIILTLLLAWQTGHRHRPSCTGLRPLREGQEHRTYLDTTEFFVVPPRTGEDWSWGGTADRAGRQLKVNITQPNDLLIFVESTRLTLNAHEILINFS